MHLVQREELISDKFVSMNKELHGRMKDFGGGSSYRWIDNIISLFDEVHPSSILDYGCGKGKLKRALSDRRNLDGILMREYDPAIEGKDDIPCFEYDLVVCTDVLEHVEPERLCSVINHLIMSISKVGFITVALLRGKKQLEDGTFAHINIHPIDWWQKMIGMFTSDFDVKSFPLITQKKHKDAVFICKKKLT